MLVIDLGIIEHYDENSNKFVTLKGGIVRFEYSLRVLYDWESKWRKPFLKGELTDKESLDFYKMMALDPIDEEFLNVEVIEILQDYIKDTNTATTFTTHESNQNGNKRSTKSKTYTAEEIYALMFMAGVPLEFENRNLNRLMIILKVIGSYNEEPKKMSRNDILAQNASLNERRKAQLKSKG